LAAGHRTVFSHPGCICLAKKMYLSGKEDKEDMIEKLLKKKLINFVNYGKTNY
jgi:hypothetical protein